MALAISIGRTMRSRNKGFTLLEIMIAVAVFAIASAALVKNAALTVKQTRMIQDKTLAYWIAENQLAKLRATPRDPSNFTTGTDRVAVTMAGRDWEVVVDTRQTENKNVNRVEVSVFTEDDPDHEVASLSGFLGRY